MRDKLPDKLEEHRIREGDYGSKPGHLYGAFVLHGPCGRPVKIISSGADSEYGWEHVSVSVDGRTPNWQEMCWVKEMFWDDEEAVMQLHPPKSSYINYHPYCLHLWRPIGIGGLGAIPLPPSILVGPKT